MHACPACSLLPAATCPSAAAPPKPLALLSRRRLPRPAPHAALVGVLCFSPTHHHTRCTCPLCSIAYASITARKTSCASMARRAAGASRQAMPEAKPARERVVLHLHAALCRASEAGAASSLRAVSQTQTRPAHSTPLLPRVSRRGVAKHPNSGSLHPLSCPAALHLTYAVRTLPWPGGV